MCRFSRNEIFLSRELPYITIQTFLSFYRLCLKYRDWPHYAYVNNLAVHPLTICYRIKNYHITIMSPWQLHFALCLPKTDFHPLIPSSRFKGLLTRINAVLWQLQTFLVAYLDKTKFTLCRLSVLFNQWLNTVHIESISSMVKWT